MSPTLYFLTGPTASGKTALSLRLAMELDAEIISCDSLQIYEGMDIGTAKPTSDELSAVVHHGIGVFPVNRGVSVHDFSLLASAAVEDIHNRGKSVLVTGGSGFYLKSFLEPIIDDIVISRETRSVVNSLYENSGLASVVARLQELNPNGVGGLDIQNPRRVIRALERCLQSGDSVLQLRANLATLPEPYAGIEKRLCVIQREDNTLRKRIEQRTREMLNAGLVEEVRELITLGLLDNKSASASIGYRETIAFINGTLESELDETINLHTWQLVRKQRKWFRKELSNSRAVNLDFFAEPSLKHVFG
ncbi:MAG: tRNA (adenosine(37)-N6)-dimethylallyltransferase MiaA [Opitutae bacterium]|nr:tRNA (adenosine(37)-N6)-dimethylallyltransferase MiaA [Opitutae bacterium]MBT5689734.1 tRNA (adenosine(37)-N6)-dimethylallyltransferase MiaA [Opitutae bacterium]MBT6463565.1 tRNA (adenosine(37)-N6)-dimethylallyltransferase MiaA [Opitutae bacterium]MBT6959130.1 tRNA (adenosine(37)-N6)-dimethylallyltransferase MiaA [Opitutae bacterium]MBT7852767.1 tRNA (adenosine(37)-N6)-dimethylallyltransferase MiaA [Opitutae bacterium]